ncbi:MAG: DUF2079 domain-containing protein, partial [Fibrobacter sp.]|nr:DUF2079 domain-containing protein [Fibrobacter sp.]
LFFIIGVICTPYLLSGVFYGFHPDILIIPETGLILYAFTKRKYLSFITGMLLIFLTKEVFILIPVIFSIIALIEKREWKWSVIPFLSSVGYALLYWYLISPTLRIGNSHVFQNLLPQSAGGILQHMVSPGILIFIVNSLLLYLPLQTISLRYSIFPVAYILFYSIFPDNSFRDPWRHYVLIIGTVSLFPIIIADISRIKKLTIPVFLIMVYAYFQWVPIAEFQNRRSDEIHKVRSLISSIPTNKSVVAHGPFMAFVAGRTLIANWIYRPKTWSEYDYLLFDRSFLPEWWQERENLNKTIDSLTISDQWNVISSVKSTILLQNLKNFK